MIRVKLGVVLAGLDVVGNILEPACVADKIWAENNWGDVWITSGIEGNHAASSWHYRGLGIDLRLTPDKARAVLLLAAMLPNHRVLLEGDHIHIQPK